MKLVISNSVMVLLLAFSVSAWSQDNGSESSPIYRVTVVSRTLQAVNYGHRTAPTTIDFQGTVLLPKAKGEATVESKRGRVSIDVRFSHLDAPTRFGREYLTYVLWAVTPEGRPKNLGEILVSASNKAHLSVTTELQAMGLMVTAEPYYAVTTPSDVVVLENMVRPDTIGTTERATARYELMPRGHYTLTLGSGHSDGAEASAAKLPYDRYEALLEVYQAQSAVLTAQAAGADRFATETFNKAETMFQQAQDLQARKQDTRRIVSLAREAAQMAEDARVIAIKHRDEQRLSSEKQQLQEERRAVAKAEADALHSQAQAEAAQAAVQAEQRMAAEAIREAEEARSAAARNAAEAEAERSRATSEEAQRMRMQSDESRQEARAQVLAELNGVLATRDTPRGLVVTVPDRLFASRGTTLRAADSAKLAKVAGTLSRHPGLTARVEGYIDEPGSGEQDQQTSQGRAEAVREALVSNGVAPGAVTAAGLGTARPVASNATAGGRLQNRRVEIVITGQAIGEHALWDRSYSMTSR